MPTALHQGLVQIRLRDHNTNLNKRSLFGPQRFALRLDVMCSLILEFVSVIYCIRFFNCIVYFGRFKICIYTKLAYIKVKFRLTQGHLQFHDNIDSSNTTIAIFTNDFPLFALKNHHVSVQKHCPRRCKHSMPYSIPPLNELTQLQASGNIGKIILDALRADGGFNITVVSRKESKAQFPDGVAVRNADYTVDELAVAFQGQDVVISAVGAAGFDQQKKMADAAILAGVQRFFPSEFSSSSQDKAVQQLLPLFGIKADLIEYLKSKESDVFSWTGIATSGLFDWVCAPEKTQI